MRTQAKYQIAKYIRSILGANVGGMDIVRISGLSVTTAYKVVHDQPVSGETVLKVIKSLRELGYITESLEKSFLDDEVIKWQRQNQNQNQTRLYARRMFQTKNF